MEDVFTYLLKSSGLIIAFFLSFYILLRNETFFTSNRWFLLFGLATSALLPFYFLTKVIYVEIPKITFSNNQLSSVTTPVIQQETSINWIAIVFLIYISIVVLLVLKEVINLISLVLLLRKKSKVKHENYILVDLEKEIAPFSFFNYIVYNSSLYSKEELENILFHEKVHCQQKHSFDVILSSLFCIVFWFNPFIWLYKKSIIQNLEYIADSKAIQQLNDKITYQKTLLKVVSFQNNLPITNHFYQPRLPGGRSLIKKRIIMLNKNQSHKRNSWKYVVVVPALFAFVFLFQVKVVAQEKINVIDTKKYTPSETKKGTVQTIEDYNLGFVFDKISSENEFKEAIDVLKKEYNIDFNYSNLKRNNNGEIIAIKLSFDNNKGKKGTVAQDRTIAIRPIFFRTKPSDDGKFNIGFYDNSDMISKPKDSVNENKIATIEDINDDMLIFVDGEKYTKESLDYLDPKGLEKIVIYKGKKAVDRFGESGKNGVADITTNWATKPVPEVVQKKIIIFQNDNGDDIVFIPSENSLKLPGYPPAQLKNYPPILIVNGVEKSNPLETLNKMDLQKVKSIRVFDENGNDTKGSAIKKIVIITK